MKARAAVQVADNEIEIQLFDVPSIEPDEILLRVEGSGICGTDHEQLAGSLTGNGYVEYPLIPGHEPVGRVAEIGETARAAWGLDVGARVAVEGFISCRVCMNCKRGLPKFCAQRFVYGYTPSTVGCGLWGGFGEYMLIRPGTVLHSIPDDLTIEDAVLFNPLGAGFEWAVRRAGTQVGDTVLILGPGQRGLACVVAAREAGAAKIIVTGLPGDRAKLDLALAFGADEVIDATGDVVAAVEAITGGAMADRVIDTTPLAVRPIVDAVDAARPAGTIVLAGMKASRAVENLVTDRIALKALNVLGVLSVGTWAYEQAIRLISSHRYPLEQMHTHTVAIDDCVRGIRLLGGDIEGETAVHVTVTP